MDGAAMMAARRIAVAVAIEVRQKAALVVQRLLERARTQRNVVGEVALVAIDVEPVVALRSRPVTAVDALPLRSEVPAERNRLRPELAGGIDGAETKLLAICG